MKKKASLLSIFLLSVSFISISCSQDKKDPGEYREISFDELKIEAEKTQYLTSPYTAAEVLFYDTLNQRTISSFREKFFVLDGEWASCYGHSYEQEAIRYLNYSLSSEIKYVERDIDNAYFSFFMNDDGFKAYCDYYDEYVYAQFNSYGQLTYLYATAYDEYQQLEGFILISINYHFDSEVSAEVDTLSTKDMELAYLADDDSYHFVGFNQHVRPNKIIIPDYYDDGIHGEKDVVDIELYPIFKSKYAESLEFGSNISKVFFNQYPNGLRNGGLEEFIVRSNSNYYSYDGILYTGNKQTLLLCPPKKAGTVTLHEETISIGPSAFYNCLLINEINFNSKLLKIESYAFYYCGITDIVIPDTVSSIHNDLFLKCPNLNSIEFGSSITSIMSGMINGCDKLKKVTIKNVTKRLSKMFIMNCFSLEDLNYTGTIEEWKNISFYGEWESGLLERISVVHCSNGDYPLTNN